MKKFEDMSKEQMEDLLGDGQFSLKQHIRVSILTQEDKSWPTFDGGQLSRRDYITASEASSCARRLAFNKRADADRVPVEDFWGTLSEDEFNARLLDMGNDDKRGIFERGNMMEEWVVQHLIAMEQPDERFFCLGKEQRSFYSNKLKVSGTPDGIRVDLVNMKYRVLEFKSSQNPITSPKEGHVTQVQVNAGLIQYLAKWGLLDDAFSVPFSRLELEGVNILYVHTDNWLDMKEFRLPYDGGLSYEQAIAKARAIWKRDHVAQKVVLRHPEEVAPEGLRTWNGCMFCEHKAECLAIVQRQEGEQTQEKLRKMLETEAGTRKREVPKMPAFRADMPKDKIAELLLEYDTERQREKEAKEHKEAVQKAIKQWIASQENRSAEFSEDGYIFSVKLTESKRSGGIDKEALAVFLKMHDLELDDYEKPATTVETLNVTVKQTQDV